MAAVRSAELTGVEGEGVIFEQQVAIRTIGRSILGAAFAPRRDMHQALDHTAGPNHRVEVLVLEENGAVAALLKHDRHRWSGREGAGQ